jgi:hypothetical protein
MTDFSAFEQSSVIWAALAPLAVTAKAIPVAATAIAYRFMTLLPNAAVSNSSVAINMVPT